jgi:hypothetical protein
MKYKFTEVQTDEFSFNPLHDYIPDRFMMTAGEQLIADLGLEKFRYIFVQKVLGYALPIYIITFNSRYPTVSLSATRVKKLKFTWVGKAKKMGIHTYVKPIKLTPPIYLKSAMISMTTGSIVIQRDISGEYLRNPKMFSYTDYKLDKKVNGL